MADATLTVSLPASIRQYVDARIAAGDYTTADEYLTALIDEDMRRRAEDELEARLLEGIESGPAAPAEWPRIREAAYRLAGADQPNSA